MNDGEDRPTAASLLDRLTAELPSSLAKGSASAKVVTPATPKGSLPPKPIAQKTPASPASGGAVGAATPAPLLRRSGPPEASKENTVEDKVVNLIDDLRVHRLVDGAEKELQALIVTAHEICSMNSLYDSEHFLGIGASYQVSSRSWQTW